MIIYIIIMDIIIVVRMPPAGGGALPAACGLRLQAAQRVGIMGLVRWERIVLQLAVPRSH